MSSSPILKTHPHNSNATIQICYEIKKCGKIFPYILVEEHYFISLWQEREGM